MENKRIRKFNEISWVLGLILLTLGVCIMSKAGFGVSMIVSPAYVLHLALVKHLPWFTFGTSEYIFQGVLLLIMCLVIRRFRWQYLLSFVCAFIYGLLLDGWIWIFRGIEFNLMYERILAFIVGELLSGLSIALFFRTYMPLEVYDSFVTEICSVYKLNQGKIKWIYDFSMLLLAVILTLCINGNLTGIGVGTFVCAVVNAPLITVFGKLLDKFISFDVMFPSLERVIGCADKESEA